MTHTTTLGEAFNPETEEGSSFDLIKPGRYIAEIEDVTCGPTKNGAGEAVNLRWKITDGEYEGRIVFQQIMLKHASTEAQSIGRKTFKDVADACGIKQAFTDLEVLKFKACAILVKVEKDKSGVYADKNRVGRVMPHTAAGNGSTPKLPF